MSSLDDLVNQLLQEHASKKAAVAVPPASGLGSGSGAAEVGNSFEELIKTVKADAPPSGQAEASAPAASPEQLAELGRLRQEVQRLAAEKEALRRQLERLQQSGVAAGDPTLPAANAQAAAPATGMAVAGAAAFPWRRHISAVEDCVRKKEVTLAEPLIKVLVDVAEVVTAEPVVKVRLMAQLAAIRIERGQFAEAEETLNKALGSVQADDNPGKHARASCLDALAQCYQQREDFDQAEKLRREAVVLAEEALGGEHPDVGFFRERLDNLRQVRQLAMIGADEASKTLLDKLTAEYNAAVAAGQPLPEDTKPADSYSGFMLDKFLGMAKTALTQKNLREAENALRSAVEKAENVANSDPRKCEAMRLMGHTYELLGRENAAKEMYEQALTLAFRHIGWGDIQVAQSLHALAKLHGQLNDLGLTKNYYTQSLAVYTNLLGREHETTVAIQQEYADFIERVKAERQWKGWAV